jgi:ketosteroid isomerase-like protein
MTDTAVPDTETAFFEALLAADRAALDTVLAHDFLLVDVMAGQIVPRAALLDLVGSRELEFLEITRNPDEVSLRDRGGLAVVIGSTRMTMSHQGTEITTNSRYTHVYVVQGDQWQLLSAQGTPIGSTTQDADGARSIESSSA